MINVSAKIQVNPRPGIDSSVRRRRREPLLTSRTWRGCTLPDAWGVNQRRTRYSPPCAIANRCRTGESCPLILGHARVHAIRPGENPAGKVVHFFESRLAQKVDRLRAA